MVSKKSLEDFYKGKKVFITGHTGFKGSWLGLVLKELGAYVKGYALAPEYKEGLYVVANLENEFESIVADIRDKQQLNKELLSFAPDLVFHLAAQPLVRRSYQIPSETFEVNVVGTANLLEAIHLLPHKCTTVVITTDKVYENREQFVLYSENDSLGGYDPYSASKACTELVVSSFRNSFFNSNNYALHGKAVTTARAGNVIGGGDWSSDRIVPDIIRHLQKNEPILVRNPSAVRPWQHVLEPLIGYLQLGLLLDKVPQTHSSPYNFGPQPSDHLTVSTLVENAIECWGEGAWVDASGASQPHEAGILQLDISKAIRELGWAPKLDATAAIRWTIEWFKQHESDKADFTRQQINNYLAS